MYPTEFHRAPACVVCCGLYLSERSRDLHGFNWQLHCPDVCRYEKEYTPLRREDIDDEPPPPLPPQSAYLQGRLQRFYAELAQYTPGVSRAAYEERLVTLGDGLLPPAPDPYGPSCHLQACACIVCVSLEGFLLLGSLPIENDSARTHCILILTLYNLVQPVPQELLCNTEH